MSFDWTEENPPHWDSQKAAIFSRIPEGIFDLPEHAAGDLLPGEWWRVETGGKVVGYGWMDCNWGDAEILLVVDPDQRSRGAGTFIVDQLEREAARRGLNYILNVVRPGHPEREQMEAWLAKRGFERHPDGELMRRAVHGSSG